MPAEHALAEVFSSIQGEGKYLGARQIFVRMAGCPVGCWYCDTDHRARETFDAFGETHTNPVTASRLANILTPHLAGHHSISFTGGEPLADVPFLLECSALLRPRIRLFLETSAYDIANLTAVKDAFDIFSVDLKMHDSTDHIPALLAALTAFPAGSWYCKVVWGDFMTSEKTAFLLRELAAHRVEEVFIQWVDNQYEHNCVEAVLELLYKQGINAFFVPQMHKMLGVR